jgi:hypothetical protein
VAGAKRTWIAADCPLASVVPADTPLAVNPLPGVLTPEMCTVAWPVLVNVDERVLFFPTVTLPKDKIGGLSPSLPTGVVVPVPERPIVVGDAGSLLVMLMLPESLPVEVGE